MDSPVVTDTYEFEEFIGTDINLLCRICCTTDDNLVAIFDSRSDENFANKIMAYLPINVSPDDVLPLKVCQNCTEMVLKWHKLYQSCKDADKKFRSFISEEKLDENLIYEVRDEVQVNDTDDTVEEGVDGCVEESIIVDSEEISDNMDVSSILREEYQVDIEDSLSECIERDSEEDYVQGSPKTNRIFKSRQLEGCPFCKIRAKSKDNLNEHLKCKHSDQIFHCEICDQLKPQNELISHMTSHALETLKKKSCHEENKTKPPSNLTCIKCNKTFANLSGMKYHMNAVHAKIKEYKCDLCEKLFARERILSNHKRSIHQKERTFKCEICSKMFKTDSTLFAHKKTHLDKYQFKCDICEKEFRFKHHLVTHSVQHSSEKNFSCSLCNKSFAIQNNLSKHMKTHSTTLDFGCHICGVRMKQRRYLQEHMKRVHHTTLSAGTSKDSSCEHLKGVCDICDTEMPNETEITMMHLKNCDTNCQILCNSCSWVIAKLTKEFPCEICGEKFPYKINLRKHVAEHNEIICYFCNKSFKTYTNLVAHKKLHQDTTPNFDCPICGLNMNRKYNLMVHISSHVADHPCRICCASFNSALLLEHHRSTHSKEDIENYADIDHNIKCDVCELLFHSRYKLYMHTLSEHNKDERTFLCHCGRIFESDIMLKNHEKTHKVLYECNVCNKKFKQLKGLQEHLNTHLDNRPYKCEECGKKFKYSSNLSQHRTMHRGIRNFSCLECGKKFLRSNTLAMHLKTHNNIRKFICEYCRASFVQSSSLTKHKKTIHRFCENCGEMVGDRKQWQIHVWKKCSASRNARRR